MQMVRIATLAPRLSTSSPSRVRVPAKTAEPFYQSTEWRELRAYVVKMAGGICRMCQMPIRGRVFVDHIRERKDGGAELDPLNTQALCSSCHNKKTASERTRRMSTRG